ncbi:hypothetical protein F8388_010547 [Cannabis sativa]|uniref:Transposase n=1 Tax=Cannabis sativa TaxID=3483 RepID=A0A7J6GSA3_CANSA|nr:hypothetical protein F8388_010547 [Cannabis sativa]
MFKLSPDDKHSTLKIVGQRWKDWKSFLTRNLIFKYKDKVPAMLDHPPNAYASCYKPEDWKAYAAKRCSPEWAKKRKKMQDIRSQIHTITMRAEVKKLGHQVTIYDGKNLWIRIHKNKKGELDGPAQEVADQIAEIRKQVEEGTVLVEGSKDILTLALGTEEHGGRVRGMGRGVTQTQFFKTLRPKRKRVNDNDRMSEVVEENAILPCPIEHEGFDTVGLAVNNFVAWPKNLVNIHPDDLAKLLSILEEKIT